nr:MAG TPA_asm: hypothetical protein [Caudoviricetes sp.]
MGQKEIKRQKPTFEGQSAEEFIKRWNAAVERIRKAAGGGEDAVSGEDCTG